MKKSMLFEQRKIQSCNEWHLVEDETVLHVLKMHRCYCYLNI
jgi:hypothetical protein